MRDGFLNVSRNLTIVFFCAPRADIVFAGTTIDNSRVSHFTTDKGIDVNVPENVNMFTDWTCVGGVESSRKIVVHDVLGLTPEQGFYGINFLLYKLVSPTLDSFSWS